MDLLGFLGLSVLFAAVAFGVGRWPRRGWLRATATVSDLSPRVADSGRKYFVATVAYRVPTSAAEIIVEDISLESRPARLGDTIPILYCPENPKAVELDPGEGAMGAHVRFMLGAAVVGLVLIGVALRRG